MGSASRRISKELADMAELAHESHVVVEPASGDDLFRWKGILTGPAGTPYEDGRFGLEIDFPDAYPFKPPAIRFATHIYHPNIDDRGEICLSVLKADEWKPATRMASLFEAIVALLVDANPEDPLRTQIADVKKHDRPRFEREAREWTRRYAT